MLTAESRQRDFPSLAGMTYLNTAAEGIPPRAVVEALADYSRDKLLGMDGRIPHQQRWESLRTRAAGLLGLTAEEVGVCSCSSEAFNLAAMALRLKPGDEVVISDLDFPAGATPWHGQARLWRSRDGAARVEDLLPLLNPHTRLVTVSLVSFYNGFTLNLRELVETVRRHCPALIAVDATQALGRVPLDLAGVDLTISSTHKWILGSHGGCLVGVPKSREREWTVPVGGWFNLSNAFDADRFERTIIHPGARSFCVGMPNYPAVYAVDAALGYIQSVGVDAIHAHAQPLVERCLSEIRKLPVELLTPVETTHLAGILAFRHPRAEQIHRALHDQNIHVMHHAGRLRVAIHGYNTGRDVERLLAAMRVSLNV